MKGQELAEFRHFRFHSHFYAAVSGTPRTGARMSRAEMVKRKGGKSQKRGQLFIRETTKCPRSLVEISGIAIYLAERRNMVLRCFQDGFLGHVHKYLGFLITDPVDTLR
jgi:hypothetical protein